jgi:hypothetical protein
LGRPAILFCHPAALRAGASAAVRQAVAAVNQAGDHVRWCGIEQVARHAYLQRRKQGRHWEVLMTGNEACLHNPDPEPRTFQLTRPRRPYGALLEVNGEPGRDADQILVRVAAGQTATVRLVHPRWLRLPRRAVCCDLEPSRLGSGREETGRAQVGA